MGVGLTTSAIEKLSLQVLYPPPGQETGLRQRDDGGRVNDIGNRKIIAAGPIPPPPGQETGLRQRDDGGRVNDIGNRKIIAAGPIPPRPGRKRDSGKGTMGVGLTT